MSDQSRVSGELFLTTLREEIHMAREQYKKKAGVYDPPDCDHCGEKMETGAAGGGEVTFGCYHNEECPFRDNHPYGYSITRTTAPATAASARIDALIDLAHQIALEKRHEHPDPNGSTPAEGE